MAYDASRRADIGKKQRRAARSVNMSCVTTHGFIGVAHYPLPRAPVSIGCHAQLQWNGRPLGIRHQRVCPRRHETEGWKTSIPQKSRATYPKVNPMMRVGFCMRTSRKAALIWLRRLPVWVVTGRGSLTD